MGASNSSSRHSDRHSEVGSGRRWSLRSRRGRRRRRYSSGGSGPPPLSPPPSEYPSSTTRVYYGTTNEGSVYSYSTTLTHYPDRRPPHGIVPAQTKQQVHSASASGVGGPTQQPHFHQPRSRKGSVDTVLTTNTMASSTSHRNRKTSTNSRTLLDRKCIFLGRYYARQFSQAVLQRLRFHVKQAKGTKTRMRLSTKGLTIGSKSNSLFSMNKAPYEFFPLDEIHEVFVDNELRSLLIVIKGLPDGHLELLTYKLTDELEARQYQQTFNEMVARGPNRPSSMVHSADLVDGPTTTITRSSAGVHTTSRPGHYNTTPSSQRRAHADVPTEGYVYRIKTEDGSGTPASRRHHKPRHRSEGDALDEELRRQIEDKRFMEEMRRHGSVDANDNDEPDGPIRLIFSKDGIIETHGNASLMKEGGSDYGSDRDSGIQSKDHPEVVDSGVGTVRATVSDYRHTSGRTSTDHTDYSSHYGNGYAGGVRSTARSPTRNSEHIVHHVVQDNSHPQHLPRSYSPAPSHQSRTQSEGGWRTKMPWRRRSKSTDSHPKWETTSLMVGGKKPMGKVYVPPNQSGPPNYIVMYPTIDKQMKARSASRFEL